MKGFTKFIFLTSALVSLIFMLAGCANDPKEPEVDSENDSTIEVKTESIEQEEMNKDEPELTVEGTTGDSVSEDKNSRTNEETRSEESNKEDENGNIENNVLSTYSSQEIEYARVWLQIVGNQDVEELIVSHTSAGEQVNPYEDDSIDYPEDIITLQGKVMAEGTVTYSGNGGGTINLYDVPSHWPSNEQIDESMKEYRESIINNTELIYIETGNDQEIINMIEKLSIH